MSKILTPDQIVRLDAMKRAAEKVYAKVLSHGAARTARIVKHACDEMFEHHNPKFFEAFKQLKRLPVPIEEFLDSPEFIGSGTENAHVEIWDTLRADLIAMNPDVIAGENPVFETLMGGATGTGKTELSKITLAYQLYLLTCFQSPQKLFRLSPSTVIVILFQSVQAGVTRRALYLPFRTMFTAMDYTRKWVKYDPTREATLALDGGIEVVPSLPNIQSMVGQAIIAAHLDEVNFMQVVENSKQVAGPRGQGGHFDQAELAYRTIARRRKSRFTTLGPSVGCLCVTSSTRYKGDFLDRRISEVSKTAEPGVKVYRRKQYEVQPIYADGAYRDDPKRHFRLLVGTETYPTRILEPHEEEGKHYPEGAWVEQVPMAYKPDFQHDPDGTMRDVIGEATNAINPFITQRHKVIQAIVRGRKRGLVPWVTKQDVELATDGLPQIEEKNLPTLEERRRDWFVHVDLSKSKDRCGIAFVRTDGTAPVMNHKSGAVEHLPRYVVPLAVTIRPSSAAEIDIADVRQWLMLLVSYYGFNIRLISYDGFQSAESMALWRKAGVMSQLVSCDLTTDPYDTLKAAFYSDRIDMVDSEIAKLELINLERNEKTGKIDHPPKGSKDLSDAIASALYSASRARDTRSEVQVTNPTGQAVRSVTVARRDIRRK